MSTADLDLNALPEEVAPARQRYDYVGSLWTNNRLVCHVVVKRLPFALPREIHFSKFEYASRCDLDNLPFFEFHPYRYSADETSRRPDQRQEWKKFMTFLFERQKVVIIVLCEWELLCKTTSVRPDEGTPLRVYYRRSSQNGSRHEQVVPSVRSVAMDHRGGMLYPDAEPLDPPGRRYGHSPHIEGGWNGAEHFNSDLPAPPSRPPSRPAARHPSRPLVQPRVGLMHPNYLQTLGQTHASWVFGGLAELVDNARDARASSLNINVSMVKMKNTQEVIPMLQIADDGTGMTHADIVRMLSFGHATSKDEDDSRIGHFGAGFKTGSIRVGKDVVVLTQNEDSRSIGFLSSSYNADKEILEVPIVTYRKVHGVMELDLRVQTRETGQACLDAVKFFSPFSEFEIGSIFEKMGTSECRNGTQIFIYNLDKWSSTYTLEWDTEDGNLRQGRSRKRDILIRSRRVRARTGQTSQEIPLDYSLRSYLELMFLDPRMTITIQGSKVKSKCLKKSLNTTEVARGKVLGKEVELILGRSSIEYQRGNCGMFLYWHGRLIEAYKRVGGMLHSADMGRGVLGVIDVTTIMGDENGKVRVLNTKQGFEDSEEYVMLEKWLGDEFNKYWYKHFDHLEVISAAKVEDDEESFEPDSEWVQCDKCRKWRRITSGARASDLPEEWFCYMEPFAKTCSEPEEREEAGVVTVAVNKTNMASQMKTKESTFSNVDQIATYEDEDVDILGLSPTPPIKHQAKLASSQHHAKRVASQHQAKHVASQQGFRPDMPPNGHHDQKKVSKVPRDSSPSMRRLRRRR